MNLSFSDFFKHKSYQVKISPNGRYVANALDNRLVIRNHNKNLTILMVHETSKPIDYVEWSPCSEYILTCNYEGGKIDIRSINSMSWHGVIKEGRVGIAKVKWSFDSTAVYYTTEFKLMLGIWNLSTAELIYIDHIKFADKGIETSPDGKYVAVARKENGKDYISIYHGISFIQLEHFATGTVDMQNFKWSPNGIFIAVWDNCLYYNLFVYRQDGTLCLDYVGYEYGLGIKSICWSPNNELLAIGNYDQTVHLISTRDWKLVSILNHPTTFTNSIKTKILELVPGTKQAKDLFDHEFLSRRPYHAEPIRTESIPANPKIGIGLCQFSMDSSYICSRNDSTPNLLWIWQIKTLACNTVVKFNQPVRQALWNPLEKHLLATICGDEYIHYIQPTNENELEIINFKVPIADFSIKKSKWNSNGDSLLLMDTDLFCLAVVK